MPEMSTQEMMTISGKLLTKLKESVDAIAKRNS